jgi:zinc protease
MKKFNYRFLRIFLHLALIVFFSISAIAQDAIDKLPKDPDLATGKLANGLTYYIRNNHKPEKKVELRLVVNAGSVLEEDDQQGLAHFMEHMEFNGTKSFEKNELVSYLQSIGVQFGADLNAYTGFDQTVFILPIPTDKPDNLEKGFQILEDWAHNASLTEQDIDDERGVVLEESRLGKGADDRMMRKYFPKLTEGTMYADRLPIGKDDIIKKFKYDRLKDFYNDWYRPDLEAVVVVGDIDTTTAKSMLIDHFSHLKNPSPEKRRKYESVKPRREPDAMVVVDKEATSTMLGIIYPYTKKHETLTVSDYKLEIIRNLALAIINHRLNDLAQSAEPPFPYAQAGFDDMIHGFECLTFYSGFNKTGPDSALNAIATEILKLKKFGVTEPELELVKKELMSGMEKIYNERNTTESRTYAEECIRNFTDKEPIPGIENEYGYYKTFIPEIKAADLNTMIKN